MSMDYLEHYLRLTKPGYAVLVNGAWGVGKTYQIERRLSELDPIYVSLFGLATVEDIHVKATLGMMSDDDRKLLEGVNAAQSVGKILLKGLSAKLATSGMGMAEKVLKERIKKNADRSRPIIFDDLERSKIPLMDLLGAINLYIEHEGFRVICVADESHLLEDEFSKFKEKIIGHTIRLEPDFDGFFDSFFESAELADIVRFRVLLQNIIESSRLQSLRVAKQIVRDTNRFHECLSEEIINNEESLRAVITEFSIWATIIHGVVGTDRAKIESINASESVSITRVAAEQNLDVSDAEQDTLNLVKELNNTFGQYGFSVGYGVLTSEYVCATLLDGAYDSAAICELIENSRLYQRAENIPAWQVLFDWRSHNNDDVKSAINRIEAEFETPQETNPSVILHIFARALWLSREGLWQWDLDQCEQRCKAYIDAVTASLPDHAVLLNRSDSYAGRGYPDENSELNEQFSRIREHLVEAARQHSDVRLKECADHLIELVKSQPRDFYSYINKNQADGFLIYLVRPFLHHIDARELAGIMKELDLADQAAVCGALRRRLHLIVGYDEKSLERNWIAQLADVMRAEAADLSPLEKLRMIDLAERFDDH